jgi:fumarylacetoacetate (FAA) hydrolase family protein
MHFLPDDWRAGQWLGRLLTAEGPTPILLRNGRLFDVSRCAPTVADFIAAGADAFRPDLAKEFEAPSFEPAWAPRRDPYPRLLAPVDLQVIKASGVTFAVSALERVIEERARGDASAADAIRAALKDRVGVDLSAVAPGSEAATRLKEALIADELWSQYLEVAIGPDAEIFTKAPVLSAVGWGDWIGVRPDSSWNNPEAEIVLVCDRAGRIAGATLGNDVNLRDLEGRSALLLGKAKDNNASCAIGPFIRLFDATFTLDDIRNAEIELEILGEDGFRLSERGSMAAISRDPAELVAQTIGPDHAYPDGFALFLGSMFAPTQDRDAPGLGFTHKRGDLVRIFSPKLGQLENKVASCREAPPWTFGLSDLMRNLAARGLLGGA